MSSKMDDILEVLVEVWSRRHVISAIRRTAEKAVAKRRGRTPATVHAKLTRGLNPFVDGVGEFDVMLSRWLYAGDLELKKILLAKATSQHDRQQIEAFFGRPGWPQAAPSSRELSQ